MSDIAKGVKILLRKLGPCDDPDTIPDNSVGTVVKVDAPDIYCRWPDGRVLPISAEYGDDFTVM